MQCNTENLKLMDVLNGVSPDYAVISQKYIEDDLIKLTNDIFENEYGVTLECLAHQYEEQHRGCNEAWFKNRIIDLGSLIEINSKKLLEKEHFMLNKIKTFEADIDKKNRGLEEKLERITHEVKGVSDSILIKKENDNVIELENMERRVNELGASSHHWWLEFERVNNTLDSIYSSFSWRSTYFLRFFNFHAKKINSNVLLLSMARVRCFLSFFRMRLKRVLYGVFKEKNILKVKDKNVNNESGCEDTNTFYSLSSNVGCVYGEVLESIGENKKDICE